MHMSTMARFRGTSAVRADASDPVTVFNELRTAVEAMRAEHAKEVADLKKGMGDYVQSEKVDRINAEIGKLQKAHDDLCAVTAALRVGGAGAPADPDRAAYATAFERFFRKGVDAGLPELAVKAALKTDSDPDGGYMVPEQMDTDINRVLGTVSAMRGIAGSMSISTSVFKKLVSQGGANYGWVGEREARPETNTPTLAELAFTSMELYGNPAATQTMLDDGAVDVAAWLAGEVSISFAEAEGAAFISGNGVNRPRGILGYTNVANSSYAWGNLGYIATAVAADINDGTHNGADALIDLVYALKQGYRTNARFLMNRTLQGKVRKLKAISTAIEEYIWQPSLQLGQPASLLGYPITDDDNMPDVGANTYPVAFGDFQRGYLIVDRIGTRVLRDPYTNKPYVMFYTTKRVGGGVQNFEAIKLLKCAAA